MRRLSVALAALALVAAPAGARPYTVDDLLRLETLGAAGLDPTGRWLAVERRAGLDAAPSWDSPDQTLRLSSGVLVIDTRADPITALPLPQRDGFGMIAGPFTADGQRLAVFGISGDAMRLGVARLSDRQVRWFDVAPYWTAYGQTLTWRTNRQLLVIVSRREGLPPGLRSLAGPATAADALRRAARQGAASATLNGSGRFAPLDEPPAQALISIDVVTGVATVLAQGDFEDMELSASGRYVALLTRKGDRPPRIGERFGGGETLVRRELMIVDLASGVVRRLCAGADLSMMVLSWSPMSDSLLVADVTSAQAPVALRIEAASGDVERLVPRGLATTPMTTLSTPSAGLAWLDGEPVVRAHRPGDARSDWYLVGGDTPINLTSTFATSPTTIAATTHDRLLVHGEDGDLLAIARSGGGAPVPGALPSPALADAGRRQVQPRLMAFEQLLTGGTAPPAADLLVAAPAVRLELRRDDLRGAVVLDRTGRAPVTVLSTNVALGEVDLVTPTPIRHGPVAAQMTSWLYQPRDRPGPLPLIVLPYPGAVYRAPPPAGDGDQVTTIGNIQVLVGAGYAVLVPSLPPLPGAADPDALAHQVDEAVSAALAAGDLDPDRVALWGHSYGGYAALAIATRTQRYRAIVASAATADLATSWGRFSPAQAATPMAGLSLGGAGWAENGQVRLGAPPWVAPDRYVTASPLYAAGQITAPVLLLHGEADSAPISQSQTMFTALQRQGKDAQLVTYFGEGHVIASPANVRDLYGRVFKFLEAVMTKRGAPSPPSANPAS